MYAKLLFNQLAIDSFWDTSIESNTIINKLFNTFLYVQVKNGDNEIVVDLVAFATFCILLIILFIGATFFLRSKRQRHLLREKRMMSSLIDNIPDTIYFKDLNSKFVRVNKAQANLLGHENPDDLIGKTDFDFFEHAQEAFDVEKEIIRTQIPVINQLHEHYRDGKKLYLSDTKIPWLDETGKCIGTVGITRDITDFKIAEYSMLENQAKFKALFDNAPLAIFRLDKNMKVVECNVRFKKMFGYSENDKLDNLSKYDLLADPELGGLILDTVLETREVNTEIMLKRKSGEEFIANLTLALLEEGFNDISIEGIVEDITQVAKAREELIKAKDKAVEADQLKSLFLANMSHEIRTPMNAIIGFTNMLREDDISHEDKNSFIDVIQNNGNSLMTLIDSIVDFSKLETEQMVVSMSEFNFKPLHDSACDYAEKLLISEEKSGIKVVRTCPEEPDIRINADRHRLGQVLNHLVSNAVKFTEKGEIEIGYFTENNKFKIFVRDTGTGIPKNKQKVIFERFSKINTDKNKLYGGTGIGLTISKGLMKLMKGKINVESTPGEGSIFTVEMNI
jgi:PAS domain S-box-containing protein